MLPWTCRGDNYCQRGALYNGIATYNDWLLFPQSSIKLTVLNLLNISDKSINLCNTTEK